MNHKQHICLKFGYVKIDNIFLDTQNVVSFLKQRPEVVLLSRVPDPGGPSPISGAHLSLSAAVRLRAA